MIKTKRLKRFHRDWSYKPVKNIQMYYVSKASTSEAQLNEFFDWCLHWCHKKFGKVKGKPIPEVEWEWNDRRYQKYNMLGEYDREENIISLRIQGHRNIYNLANTIIHEYIHYLQPTHGNWYDRYDRTWGYSKNPYEIEAFWIGDTYAVEAATTVIHWMKKSPKRGREERVKRGGVSTPIYTE